MALLTFVQVPYNFEAASLETCFFQTGCLGAVSLVYFYLTLQGLKLNFNSTHHMGD